MSFSPEEEIICAALAELVRRGLEASNDLVNSRCATSKFRTHATALTDEIAGWLTAHVGPEASKAFMEAPPVVPLMGLAPEYVHVHQQLAGRVSHLAEFAVKLCGYERRLASDRASV